MNILFIRSLNPFFESSASGNRFASIIKGLLENDINVTLVITGGYNNLNEFKYKKNFAQYNNLSIYYTNFIFNNNIWFRRFNRYLIKDITNLINLYKLKRFFKKKYDYIFLTNSSDCLSAFNKYYNIITCKSIIELNEFNDFYKGHNLNPIQLKVIQNNEKLFLSAVNKIDCFAIMTNTLLEHYKKIAKTDAKFLHFPMTVDLSRFNIDKNDVKYSKPYIAYTGALSNNKDGIDILIKAFNIISQKYSDIHLYLAGFYSGDVIMQKELIEKYKLKERVTYLGTLDKEEIPNFICNASLLVLPRPESHQAQGGFPTKLGEYLASGNPVCVTRVGEIPDYLEDNISAFMAEPGDIASFADAMDRALCNSNEKINVGLNGRKVAEEIFNIDIQSKRLVDFLYENLKIDK